MSINIFMVIFMVGCVNADLFGQDIYKSVSDRIRQSLHFPIFKPFFIAPPTIPTPEEIANKKPGPGEIFSGVSFSSQSTSTSHNGKTQGSSSGTIIMNDNGEVKKFQYGDPQPVKKNNNPVLQIQNFEIPFPKIPIWRRFNFVNPLNSRTYNPGNGNFQQSSMVYVGGNGGGVADIVQNINGKITHEVIDLNPEN